jgi:hypothetical protein
MNRSLGMPCGCRALSFAALSNRFKIVLANQCAYGVGRGGAAGCRVKSKQSAMSSALASR